MQYFSECDVDKNVPLQEECASCKSVDQGGAVSCHATLGWLVIANKGPAPSSPPHLLRLPRTVILASTLPRAGIGCMPHKNICH